jgi:environmental stress-induced protein Ves
MSTSVRPEAEREASQGLTQKEDWPTHRPPCKCPYHFSADISATSPKAFACADFNGVDRRQHCAARTRRKVLRRSSWCFVSQHRASSHSPLSVI